MKKVWIALAIVGVIVAGVFGWRAYLVHELRKPVLAKLNDPDSAKFRNEALSLGWTVRSALLCGEVNAKNRMGGYVGYVPYKSLAGMDADIGSDNITLQMIKKTCSEN